MGREGPADGGRGADAELEGDLAAKAEEAPDGEALVVDIVGMGVDNSGGHIAFVGPLRVGAVDTPRTRLVRMVGLDPSEALEFDEELEVSSS